MKYTFKTIAIILSLYCLTYHQVFPQQNIKNTRNLWGMTQQQYELNENTSVTELNSFPETHPNYGALPLADVSYVTDFLYNGESSSIGQFRFQAAPSHYLKDDPILFPGQPGGSHLHMFFGNTRADAYGEVGTGILNDLLMKGAIDLS